MSVELGARRWKDPMTRTLLSRIHTLCGYIVMRDRSTGRRSGIGIDTQQTYNNTKRMDVFSLSEEQMSVGPCRKLPLV